MSAVYVALDVEATGMDPDRDEIIEVAAIRFRDDRVLDRWETLVRPQGSIPFNITSLTGIGAKDVRRAPIFAAVAPRLRDFVRNFPIVGQSPEFDLQMLNGSGLSLPNPLYDTFQLATMLIPDLPAYNLSTIAARLGVSVPQSHRAMADVETTMAVFLGLYDLLLGHDPTTLRRLGDYARIAGSPLARLFDDAYRESSLDGGAGMGSIAEQLLAKGAESAAVGPDVMFLYQRERPKRLEPRSDGQPTSPDELRSWMDPGGALARTFPGFEARPQQVEMMTAAAGALEAGGIYLMEAGTGTGKSLAYLLPAILHAVEHGEPVVISTNTIALQDQLFRKDLPDLRRSLQAMAKDDPKLRRAAEFEASLLKGRSNYLCLRRWFLAERESARTPEEASLHAKVLTWVQQTETGDRAEIHLSPDDQPYWQHLSEEEGSCIPARCVFHRRNQCFLFRARHKAESAHIIVVNHALLLSDMLASNSVLPIYRYLIVDEAHNLEEVATDQLGFNVNRSRLADLVTRCIVEEPTGIGGVIGLIWKLTQQSAQPRAVSIARQLQPRLDALVADSQRVREEVDRFFRELSGFVERYRDDRGDYDYRIRLTDAVRTNPGWGELEILWDDVATSLRTFAGLLDWLVTEWDGITDDEISGHDDAATEIELLARIGHDILEQIQSAVSEPAADMIYWLSRRATTGEVTVHAAPLHIGKALEEHLFSRCETTILTSATLTTDGSFGYLRNRLGIEDATELRVASPFDYPRTTLLYLADDLPEPGQPGHQRQLQETLIDLCKATRGRAMVLFTSHSALQSAYRAIKRPLEAEGILVLAQRTDGSPRQLVERMRAHNGAVLLGTNSFWEGVDIIGDALSLLVITKLPFSVPSDPVFAARGESYDNAFQDYAIPQAALRLKQGFGRLIRSRSDRGVCAILDRRVVSRRYGSTFVHSLPECTVEVGPMSTLPSKAMRWLQ